MISPPLPVTLTLEEPSVPKNQADYNHSPEILRTAAAAAAAAAAAVADDYQERLKRSGDWTIFPRTLQYIAEGRYAQDEEGNLFFDGNPIPHGLSLDPAALLD